MRIRYFAWIKDITKKDDDIIDINHPKNIQELKIYLENIYPELKKHFSQAELDSFVSMSNKIIDIISFENIYT
mgnify:CR=1 FL=1